MPDHPRKLGDIFLNRTDCLISPASRPLHMSPCASLADWHAAKLELCDFMEAIADSLPERIDRHVCLRVGSELLPVIRKAHAYEETAIFPVFACGSGNAVAVSRLRTEHFEDETLGEDVTEALLHIGHGGEVNNPDALGFMLRALFDNLRRHIAFEREHVAPWVDTGDLR